METEQSYNFKYACTTTKKNVHFLRHRRTYCLNSGDDSAGAAATVGRVVSRWRRGRNLWSVLETASTVETTLVPVAAIIVATVATIAVEVPVLTDTTERLAFAVTTVADAFCVGSSSGSFTISSGRGVIVVQLRSFFLSLAQQVRWSEANCYSILSLLFRLVRKK